MTTTTGKGAALLAAIPELRGFAIALCGSRDQGDDLVQETLLKAWAHLADFGEGSNMGAWLFTILRNLFFNECRRRSHQVEDIDGHHAARVPIVPEQEGWAIAADLRYALGRLPAPQREAMILVGGAGMSIEQAAAVCGCQPGTIKSRLSRGRARLAALLGDAWAGDEIAEDAKEGPQALTHRARRHARETRLHA